MVRVFVYNGYSVQYTIPILVVLKFNKTYQNLCTNIFYSMNRFLVTKKENAFF